jgi:hypothetical protein
MKIQTFKVDEYRNCPVYYRNFKDHFEYLTIIKGQLYTAHIRVKPHWITKTMYLLGAEQKQYSDPQLKRILKQLRIMAEATIDFKLGKKK